MWKAGSTITLMNQMQVMNQMQSSFLYSIICVDHKITECAENVLELSWCAISMMFAVRVSSPDQEEMEWKQGFHGSLESGQMRRLGL